MGAAGHDRECGDDPARQDHGVGAERAEALNHLLDRHHRAFGAEHRLLLHADDTLDQDVAFGVGLLGMARMRRSMLTP